MRILIDGEGRSWACEEPTDSNTAWEFGFVSIRSERTCLVVLLRPSLVRPKAVAATGYLIGDLRPRWILLSTDPNQPDGGKWFPKPGDVFRRIGDLIAQAQTAAIGGPDNGLTLRAGHCLH